MHRKEFKTMAETLNRQYTMANKLADKSATYERQAVIADMVDACCDMFRRVSTSFNEELFRDTVYKTKII